MKFLLLVAILTANFAMANDTSADDPRGEIVASSMKRGDPMYSILYGFKDLESWQDGSNRKANVILECKKGPQLSSSVHKSYITFISDERKYELIKELPSARCEELFELMQNATPQNPVDFNELLQ